MGYIKGIKRSDFFNELTLEMQERYFGLKRDKFLPTIDNIYYTVFLENDNNENKTVERLLERLEGLKKMAMTSHEPQEFENGLVLDNKSYMMYKYCLSNPDLYDIFIAGYLPNENNPRIVVQIRSFGLWIYSADKMLTESYRHVADIFEPLGCRIECCRESRIDYCYHTNIIVNPENIFKDRNINNQMHTTMQRWKQVGRIEVEEKKTVLKKDYFALGDRSSNNVFIRMYNKGLEVVEEGYKAFFFNIWYENGLINFYDKYCLEYAYSQTQKDFDYVHKAKLCFYLEYGIDDSVKKEISLTLDNPSSTMKDFKSLAAQYMPAITTVMNIEFETKRKFYYYSDEFIDAVLKYKPREGTQEPLKRLFKIIDNRAVFLDYLTSKTVCFKGLGDEYVAWWERLRNTKLDGIKAEEKLLRDYSTNLDERLAKIRFINSVATNAVYNDNIESDFINDISDVLSNLNDNHVNALKITGYTDDGEIKAYMSSGLLNQYMNKKVNKEKKLRNRKKKA